MGTRITLPSLALAGILASPSPLARSSSDPGDFAAVTAGADHTCGLTTGGRVYCWGDNAEGELGTGSRVDARLPTGLSSSLIFLKIDAGSRFTCGIAETGDAYCWGANDRGQLGNAATPRSLAPAAVIGGLRFRSISAGGEHTCAVSDQGVAYCWGANEEGQLGTGNTAASSRPLAVSSDRRYLSITAGDTHTCAIAADSVAYCWGGNKLGQLGIGKRGLFTTPQAVVFYRKWSMLSAGGRHTCGVAADGRPIVYCWGDNFHGQVGGVGSAARSRIPSFIPRTALDAPDIIGVTTGRLHTCAYRRHAANGVGCWGENLDDQLGQRTFGAYRQASAGDAHTCALRQDGAIYCWGRNASGQLGDGTTFNERWPVRVAEPVALQP